MENTLLKLKVDDTWKAIADNSTATGVYGNATLGIEDSIKYFEYNLTRFMNGPDVFELGVEPIVTDTNGTDDTAGTEDELSIVDATDEEDSTIVKTVTMMPASNVYYEDNFSNDQVYKDGGITVNDSRISDGGIVFSGNWTAVTVGEEAGSYGSDGSHNPADDSTENVKDTINQQEGKPTEEDYAYGYDPNYDNQQTFSNGTAYKADASNGIVKAFFQFHGQGIDIYSRTNSDTAVVIFNLCEKNAEEVWVPVKSEMIDTLYKIGDLYQVPLVSFKGLESKEYRVELMVSQKKIKNDTGNVVDSRCFFYLDGIRVYNPAGGSSATESEYAKIGEASADYTELRDILLEQYTGDTLYGLVYIDNTKVESEFIKAPGNGETLADATKYEEYGPKNEVYLKGDTSAAFSVVYKEGMSLQLGARAAENSDSKAAKAKLMVTVTNEDDASASPAVTGFGDDPNYINLTSTSDMYYRIKLPEVKEGELLTVTIINATVDSDNANGFAALTKIKQSYDKPNQSPSSYIVNTNTITTAVKAIKNLEATVSPNKGNTPTVGEDIEDALKNAMEDSLKNTGKKTNSTGNNSSNSSASSVNQSDEAAASVDSEIADIAEAEQTTDSTEEAIIEKEVIFEDDAQPVEKAGVESCSDAYEIEKKDEAAGKDTKIASAKIDAAEKTMGAETVEGGVIITTAEHNNIFMTIIQFFKDILSGIKEMLGM